jgi:peptidoglycan/LPS O-acetylase OafA/YrhL
MVAAYTSSHVAPYWPFHDPEISVIADITRELFDVFIMPTFFLMAGYFGWNSLQKKSGNEFLKDKFQRLMVYWIFIIVFFMPFNWWKFNGIDLLYDNYSVYWLTYMANIGYFFLGPIVSSSVPGPSFSQHFWYIPLLFYVFIGHLTLRTISKKISKTKSDPSKSSSKEKKSQLAKIIVIASLILAGVYFVFFLLVPDIYWVNINLIVQFQPTKIGGFIVTYVMGVFLASNGILKGKVEVKVKELLIWGSLTVLLSFSYIFIGTDIFFNVESPSSNLSVLLLLSFNRSFLLTSTLIFLVKISQRYFNKPSFLNRDLAKQSYNIYLIHVYVVYLFQMLFIQWTSGFLLLKIVLGIIGVLFTSYVISKYVMEKHLRVFALVIFGIFFLLPMLAGIFPILNSI